MRLKPIQKRHLSCHNYPHYVNTVMGDGEGERKDVKGRTQSFFFFCTVQLHCLFCFQWSILGAFRQIKHGPKDHELKDMVCQTSFPFLLCDPNDPAWSTGGWLSLSLSRRLSLSLFSLSLSLCVCVYVCVCVCVCVCVLCVCVCVCAQNCIG